MGKKKKHRKKAKGLSPEVLAAMIEELKRTNASTTYVYQPDAKTKQINKHKKKIVSNFSNKALKRMLTELNLVAQYYDYGDTNTCDCSCCYNWSWNKQLQTLLGDLPFDPNAATTDKICLYFDGKIKSCLLKYLKDSDLPIFNQIVTEDGIWRIIFDYLKKDIYFY